MIEKLLCFLILFAADLSAAEKQFDRTTLIELYSSEGCSSCPPAEKQMTGLSSRAGLWKTFVPVSFHVDYWDRLGWSDRFANRRYADRQRLYAAAWEKGSVYTPAFVKNGADRGSSLPDLSPAGKTSVGINAQIRGKEIQIRVEKPPGRFRGYFAILASGLSTDVQAGENSGKKLHHGFVVVHLEERAVTEGEMGFAAKPVSLGQTSLAYAYWVVKDGQTEPLQAVGGPLAGF